MSQVELNNRSLACGRCWLLSDWYCIGCQNNKKYPPIPVYPVPVNIAQYPITQYQYRSNPIICLCCAVHKNILVCLWIVASTRESSKITMKVHFDASPEDVIAESIRRKIRTMNVSAEQQQKCVTTHVTSYVLKVCGCEEFLLGSHPISQYKVQVCMFSEWKFSTKLQKAADL